MSPSFIGARPYLQLPVGAGDLCQLLSPRTFVSPSFSRELRSPASQVAEIRIPDMYCRACPRASPCPRTPPNACRPKPSSAPPTMKNPSPILAVADSTCRRNASSKKAVAGPSCRPTVVMQSRRQAFCESCHPRRRKPSKCGRLKPLRGRIAMRRPALLHKRACRRDESPDRDDTWIKELIQALCSVANSSI